MMILIEEDFIRNALNYLWCWVQLLERSCYLVEEIFYGKLFVAFSCTFKKFSKELKFCSGKFFTSHEK